MPSWKQIIRKVLPSSLWTQLRKARLAYEYWSFPKYTVTRRYGKTALQLEIHDGVARDWYDRDWDELHELRFLESQGVLRPGAKVFDLGAHQCIVAMMIADIVEASGAVLALEPIPANVRAARRNLELNSANNVTLLAGAVSNASGKDPEFGRMYTIDELVAAHGLPGLIMIDVEGFEGFALQGAKQTIETPCHWLIEVHHHAGLENLGFRVADILQYFPRSRYELWAGPVDTPLIPLPEDSHPASRFMLACIHRG
jgi:hypothetical protein